MTLPLEDSTAESAAPPLTEGRRFWNVVAEALRGSPQDFTKGSVRRAIVLLAVPMVLEMALESVFAVTDVFFVGRLGAGAIATIGITESVLAVLYTVAAGLGVGATAMVARRIGEHDRDGAGRTAVQAVVLGLAAASVFGLCGLLFGSRVLGLMGADPSVVALGSGYTRIMIGGSGTILLLFLLNAIFRGAGDAAIAMRVLWLANAINIVLGPCLIFGLGPFPKLGVTGAAIATTIGRGTGVVFALSRLLRPGGRVSVAGHHLRIEPSIMGRLVRLSGSGALQTFINTASWIGLVRIVATFGSEVLAGYTIGIRVIVFAILPSWGLSNAAATMVGQALGAHDPERAEQAVWITALYDCIVLGTIGVVFVIGAPSIVGIFTNDPTVLRAGISCLRIVALGFPLYAFEMVTIQSFNGAGDTWTPTVLNFAIFWLFQIPAAYVVGVELGAGPRGVFTVMTLSFCLLAVIAALLFRRGKWKRIKL